MTTSTKLPQHKCGRCPARWGGANTAHCAACHETFTSVTTFDRHRARRRVVEGGKRRWLGEDGVCTPPADLGLVQNDRGQWLLPNESGFDFKSLRDSAE